MQTEAVIIAGVAVKLHKCTCGFAVFEADCYGVGERVTFDVLPVDVMEMVSGNDAVFHRPRSTPSFARHVCTVEGAGP